MKLNSEFWNFARERYRILLRRNSGHPWPWTENKVLQSYKFTNVFREDDRVTRTIRTEVRDMINDPCRLVESLLACRLINRNENIRRIAPVLREDGWNFTRIKKRLEGVKPLIGSAYMIVTPAGFNKLDGINEIIKPVKEKLLDYVGSIKPNSTPMQDVWGWFTQFPFIGPFIAYEVVLDIRRTPLLGNPPDRNVWAAVGPGSARGAGWVLEGRPIFNYTNKTTHSSVILVMQALLLESIICSKFWPAEFPGLEMEDVENLLCEFDKYCRTIYDGKRPKQKYAHNS